MNCRIRKAEIHEIPLLIDWRMEVLNEVFGIQSESSQRKLKESNLRYYQSSMMDGSHIAVFAENDGEIIGCGGACLYQEMPSPDNITGQCAYLMNIYARKEYRGMGVGTNIVKELLTLIQGKGISKVYLETSEMAKKLYQELGFEDMEDYMILE